MTPLHTETSDLNSIAVLKKKFSEKMGSITSVVTFFAQAKIKPEERDQLLQMLPTL
jgi:hypothetical protein